MSYDRLVVQLPAGARVVCFDIPRNRWRVRVPARRGLRWGYNYYRRQVVFDLPPHEGQVPSGDTLDRMHMITGSSRFRYRPSPDEAPVEPAARRVPRCPDGMP